MKCGKILVGFICVLDYNVCCSLYDVSETPLFPFFFFFFFFPKKKKFLSSPPLSPLNTPFYLSFVWGGKERKKFQCWGAQKGKRGKINKLWMKFE